MTLSVGLDRKTEMLVTRLARKRRQTKSALIRDAVAMLASQKSAFSIKKKPYDRVKHLIGCVDSGCRNLSTRTGDKFYEMLIADRSKRK